jgi:ATP-dependent DNA helicase RecG
MDKLTSERKFMQIAIDEMLQSRTEHANKFDPMVGAVLVDRRGKLLAKAHRGTFSAGEHAEFTILEKLVPHIDPSGCTLYTTLEPCTPRTRKPPKVSCARRIVDKQIGRVVIGVADPNPEVHGQGIQLLLDHAVKVEFFDSDLVEQILDANRDFIEHYERVSPKLLPQPTKTPIVPTERPDTPSYVEYQPVPNATIEDLSQEAIEEFLPYLRSRIGLDVKMGNDNLWHSLKKLRFLVHTIDSGQLEPTICGMLLFGKNPDLFLPNYKVKVVWYAREPTRAHLVEDLRFPPKDVCGPLSRVIDDTVGFLKENLNKVPLIEGTQRIETIEYPEGVLREVIVNALVHRDYGLTTMYTLIEVFPNRIRVKSPGLLVKPITLESVRQFNNVGSIHRNPRIVDTMHHLHRMEEAGLGIPTMPRLLEKHGLIPPSFELDGGYFVVTLFGRDFSPVSMLVPSEVRSALNSRQIKILEYIKKHSKITSEDCTREFDITRETANQDFRVLMKFSLVKRNGLGRGTYYTLS